MGSNLKRRILVNAISPLLISVETNLKNILFLSSSLPRWNIWLSSLALSLLSSWCSEQAMVGISMLLLSKNNRFEWFDWLIGLSGDICSLSLWKGSMLSLFLLTTTNQLKRYNYLVMAIILSSFGKGFVFLMMIWKYDIFTFNIIINIFVFTSNVLALRGRSHRSILMKAMHSFTLTNTPPPPSPSTNSLLGQFNFESSLFDCLRTCSKNRFLLGFLSLVTNHIVSGDSVPTLKTFVPIK